MSLPRPLAAEPLSAAAFAPFGEVIEASPQATHFPINGGNTTRFHDLARLEPGCEGRAIVSIFRSAGHALPLTISMLERHPLGSQAFMPLSGQPYLVVVAPPGPAPDPAALRCFVAGPGQGVNYAPGVWHHPLLALAAADFLVIDRSGPGDNCEEYTLAQARVLEPL